MGSNSLGLDLPLQFFPAMVVSQNMQQEEEKEEGEGGEEEEEQDLLQPSSSSMDMSSSSTESRSKAGLDQPVKCPRCHSFNTKFCYYNNYSFTQPRHYCKSCKRYWTKGGNLRNVPVGGGCRKNKRPNSSAFQRRNFATSTFIGVAGNEEDEGEKGRESMALHEEQNPKRCKTEEESFIPEFSNLPLLSQLHQLPQLDSPFPAFASLHLQVPKQTDQNFFDDGNEGLSQTQTQSTSDVGRVSLADSVALSDIKPSLVNCANSGFDTRKQNVDHHDEHQQDSQQGGQQEKNLNIVPADQILVDEKAWRHLVADASAETIDQMKDNFFITGSQKLPSDFKDVAFDWQMGSEGFDPTNDLSYMGGPEFWSGFQTFDAGSGTVI